MKINYDLDPGTTDFSDYRNVDRFSMAQNYIQANNMDTYVSNQDEIKAFQWYGTMESARDHIPEADGDKFELTHEPQPLLYVVDNMVSQPCRRGDYIIRTKDGQYYVCTPDLFKVLFKKK